MLDNARAGNDTLASGTGTDHMWGDAAFINGVAASPTADTGTVATGADTYAFAPGSGDDDINDFRQSDGDRIDVHAYGFTHLEDMTITGDGHNTTISFDDASSVTLVGFADPDALHVTDFLFA
jgi:serralysin